MSLHGHHLKNMLPASAIKRLTFDFTIDQIISIGLSIGQYGANLKILFLFKISCSSSFSRLECAWAGFYSLLGWERKSIVSITKYFGWKYFPFKIIPCRLSDVRNFFHSFQRDFDNFDISADLELWNIKCQNFEEDQNEPIPKNYLFLENGK